MKKIMQTHLLVGPIPIKGGCRRFSSSISGDLLPPSSNPISQDLYHHRRRYRNRSKSTITSATYSSSSSSSSSASNTSGQKNHYVVLGIARNATQVDIKRAYRLLARKVMMLHGALFRFVASEVAMKDLTRFSLIAVVNMSLCSRLDHF